MNTCLSLLLGSISKLSSEIFFPMSLSEFSNSDSCLCLTQEFPICGFFKSDKTEKLKHSVKHAMDVKLWVDQAILNPFTTELPQGPWQNECRLLKLRDKIGRKLC